MAENDQRVAEFVKVLGVSLEPWQERVLVHIMDGGTIPHMLPATHRRPVDRETYHLLRYAFDQISADADVRPVEADIEWVSDHEYVIHDAPAAGLEHP